MVTGARRYGRKAKVMRKDRGYNADMRWGASAVFLLISIPILAGEMMPVGMIRGRLLTWQGGSLSVRGADGAVYDCSYDNHTLFQRNHWPIQAADLQGGEPVEVLSDRKPGTHACYARVLSVTTVAPPHDARRARNAAGASRTDAWMPRGHLTFSGLVVQQDGEQVTLKTREGLQTLRLRSDTRYSADGVRLQQPEPLLNRHVFIRAGRNLQGALEAYQVMWGEILNP
jgi:hypothetical protein